jgi:hypothetical protein
MSGTLHTRLPLLTAGCAPAVNAAVSDLMVADDSASVECSGSVESLESVSTTAMSLASSL